MVKRIKKIEYLLLPLIIIIFIFVSGKYFYSPIVKKTADKGSLYFITKNYVEAKVEKIKKVFADEKVCPPDKKTIDAPGGRLCRADAEPSIWLTIFDTYPVSGGGKEIIYDFLDEGDIELANKYLDNWHPVDRFDPIKLESGIKWTEDPYGDRYWRFIFYSLRSTRNLLYAGKQTGNQKYNEKLVEITNSFVDNGMDKPHSWDDYHGVSFRTMILVNTWWKLREQDALPIDTSTKILQALKVHGDFLADEKHYEADNNHAVSEASALFLLAANFPDMPGSKEWMEIAKYRLNGNLTDIVDSDGVQLESSPYYHFYVLEKYWEIYRYSKKFNIPISDQFDDRIRLMVSYATYILQPDLKVPLLGASLDRKVNFSGIDKEIAKSDPYFLYVLTKGEQGKKPPKLNLKYPDSGHVIMRSGWGKGEDFGKETQLIFDIGPYRTKHSDLDALNFSLFGAGINLLPDSGLYTYEEGEHKDYFQGTSAHNTVIVDGKDQKRGAPIVGEFIEGNSFASQTAESMLYNKVIHQRSLTLLGKNLVLIIDNLLSDDRHKYEQLFHLFPEAKLETSGLTVKGAGSREGQSITIRQLNTAGVTLDYLKGQTSPPKGLCSFQYLKTVPCYYVSYSQEANTASFVTLLEIGSDSKLEASIDESSNTVKIITSKKEYTVNYKTPSNYSIQKVNVVDNDPLTREQESIDTFRDPASWIRENGDGSGGNLRIDEAGFLELTAPNNSSLIAATKAYPLNLGSKNLLFRIKVPEISVADKLEVSLSTNNWQGYVTNDLRNSYRLEYADEWVTVSLGKGKERNTGGQWREYGSGFDWSNIDKIRFRVSAQSGQSARLIIDQLAVIPAQAEGAAVIVFDDGYRSILPAAEIMKNYGIKGNVAVIADYTSETMSVKRLVGYLLLEDLRKLQNEYGWNMVNHSQAHRNAITDYYDKDNLSGLEQDILNGARFLVENGINSAPNWYIYPNGATNSEIKDIVGKYYKFARTTQTQPEVFPFGEPLGVKTFAVEDVTTTEEISKAVSDAKKYNLTLFLTFHRIKNRPEDAGGYEIQKFEQVIKDIAAQGLPVKTLSELDSSNKVSFNKMEIVGEIPEQINLDIDVKSRTFVRSIVEKVFSYNNKNKQKEQKTIVKSFADTFDDKKVLEEVGNMNKSANSDWWLNSGAVVYFEDGVAKTLHGELPKDSKWQAIYSHSSPDSTDDGYHPQNILRMVTRTRWQDFVQEVYYKIVKDNLSQSTHRDMSNGLLLFNRYQDGNNLYYAGIRVDGDAVIKKKINGTYYTIAEKKIFSDSSYDREKNPNLIPKDTWIGLRTEVQTNPDKTVSINLYMDNGKTGEWSLVLEASDDGKSYGGPAIIEEGYAGIRTDFMDVEFDDYRIEKR